MCDQRMTGGVGLPSEVPEAAMIVRGRHNFILLWRRTRRSRRQARATARRWARRKDLSFTRTDAAKMIALIGRG